MIETLKQTLVEELQAQQVAECTYRAKERELRAELSRVQQKLARLHNERYDLVPTVDWIETFVKPLAKAVQDTLNLEGYGVFGPFGLRQEVSIYWHDRPVIEGDPLYRLVLTPINLEQGIIHYDTRQRYSSDGQSPVSGICGLNNQTLPLPATLERLVEQLQMHPFRTLKTTKNEGSDVR